MPEQESEPETTARLRRDVDRQQHELSRLRNEVERLSRMRAGDNKTTITTRDDEEPPPPQPNKES